MNSRILQQKRILAYALMLAGMLTGALFSVHVSSVESSSTDNLSGYAWSDTIGWISFNCTNTGTCATSPYGVTVASTGAISGYAWSEHIGWISFNAADVSGCPSGTCAPSFNKTTGVVTGWAKALAGGSGGWDGWISLVGSNYGVVATGCGWSGYAWGSDVVGWVSFSGAGYGITGTGNACINTNPDLTPNNLIVSPIVKAGTTISLSASVFNNSTIGTTTGFSDQFTYKFDDASPTTWDTISNGTVNHAGINGNESLNDAISFALPSGQTGNLYIRYCVDSLNTINEGSNETNCIVSSPIRVISGMLTALPSPDVVYGLTAMLTWSTQDAAGLTCAVTGGPLPSPMQGVSGNGSTSPLTAATNMYVLGCNGVPLANVTLLVNTDPVLTASPRTVAENGNTTLTADLKGQVGCTLTGGGKSYDLTSATSFVEAIEARTTFTLSCPLGNDTVTVDIIPKGFET